MQHADLRPRYSLGKKTIDQQLRLVGRNVAGRPRLVRFVVRQQSNVRFVGHFELRPWNHRMARGAVWKGTSFLEGDSDAIITADAKNAQVTEV